MEEYINKSLRNSVIALGAVSAMGISGLAGVSAVSAHAGSSGQDGLIDKLANKFNLNKDEVKSVFEQARTEHRAEMEANREERLQTLVDDGTITASQKTAIETKLKELESAREMDKSSNKDLTRTQRKAKMEQKKSELKTWAKDQGLDLNKMKGVFMQGHHGPGGLKYQD